MENKNYEDLRSYPDVLTLKEVSEYLKASKDTVRKLCVSSKLNHTRIGNMYRFTKKDILDFLENR